MAAPIVLPTPQFCDENGTPYANGTIELYVPGTSTPKSAWLDPDQGALNENPIRLNSAGRCLWYGDGDYRIVLRDADGNQIYDVEATTIVSAAMAPVVSAPTIADARSRLGVDDAIAQEAADRAAADSAEQTARFAADTAETNARTAADNTLQSHIDAEVARATAAETAITGGLPGKIQYGTTVADSDGHKRVAFGSSYSAAPALVVSQLGTTYDVTSETVHSDNTGFDVWFAFPGSGAPTPAGPRPFYWIAIGPA